MSTDNVGDLLSYLLGLGGTDVKHLLGVGFTVEDRALLRVVDQRASALEQVLRVVREGLRIASPEAFSAHPDDPETP